MKKCENCSAFNEVDANFCYSCGSKLDKKNIWIKILGISTIVIGFILLVNDTEDYSENIDNSIDNSQIRNENDEKDIQTEINSVEQVEKFSYTILRQYNTYYTYYIEGTVTNNRSRNYSYVQIEFVCYDFNGNNIGTAVDNTNNLLANETWLYKAMLLSSNNDVSYCNFYKISSY